MSNPPKRSRKSRLASWARVTGFAACVLGIGCIAAVVKAQGEARLATVQLGRGLFQLREFLGPQTDILINGNRMFAGGTHVDAPLPVVLDRFEQHCRDLGWQPDRKEAESFPQAVQKKLGALGAASLTLSSHRSADEGVVACLLAPPKAHGFGQFLERARAFSVNGNLGEVGDIRYVFARKGAAGGTDVVTVWTEGEFNMNALTESQHDVPGTDLAGAPRPSGSRRILDVEMARGQYGLKSYRAPGMPGPALAGYGRSLMASGWREIATGIDPGQSRTFTKDGAALIVSAHADGDAARIDIMPVGTHGYSDVSAALGG